MPAPSSFASPARSCCRPAATSLETDSVKASLAPAPTTGDPALMERLIANLLDNAIGHNDDRGVVEISTGSSDEEAYLTVANTGPVVLTRLVERLFEAFRRTDELRSARG